MPVLHHVRKKTLCLKDYTLSIGHAKALARACEYFEIENINRIVLDNCGVDDEEFSNILRGVQKLRDFKQIIYKRNIFMRESLNNLLPLLQKKVPNHLEELRIENCKTGEDVMVSLVA